MKPPSVEDRAAIRPTLPPSKPTISQWQEPPTTIASNQSPLPNHVSTIIIGSGITGASIAYHLVHHNDCPPSILMLEARTACSGATGRNGGHTKHASYRSFLDNALAYGDREAAKIARFECQSIKDVHACARKEGIQCESWEGDTVDVFYDRDQWDKAQKSVAQMKKVLGEEDPAARYTFHTAQEAAEKFLVKDTLGALSYEAGSLSAYEFTTGLLQVCIKSGLNLQTESPVLNVESRGSEGSEGWTVSTSRGPITADKVVLATNGYSARLVPSLQGIIVPLRGHMTAQRPGSRLPKPSLPNTYSFIYSDGYEYMVPRPSTSPFPGDIMIGGGSTKAAYSGISEFGTTDDTVTDPAVVNYLTDCTTSYFGEENWGKDSVEGRLRRAWTGIMGYSADGFPLVGEVPDHEGLYIAASFQGLGMVLSFNCGRAMVGMMLGDNEEERKSWFPKVFEISRKRMTYKFKGRLHTEVGSMDLEAKAQA